MTRTLLLFTLLISLLSVNTFAAQSLTIGNFHAIVIGNNDYKGESGVWHDLQTPGENAETLTQILNDKYNFESLTLLRNATKKEIVYALEELPTRIQKNDSVLIYYAGHAKKRVQLSIGYPPMPKETAKVVISTRMIFEDLSIRSPATQSIFCLYQMHHSINP